MANPTPQHGGSGSVWENLLRSLQVSPQDQAGAKLFDWYNGSAGGVAPFNPFYVDFDTQNAASKQQADLNAQRLAYLQKYKAGQAPAPTDGFLNQVFNYQENTGPNGIPWPAPPSSVLWPQ